MDLTPTQTNLMKVLADGRPHTHGEMLRVLDEDGMAETSALQFHVCTLRKKLGKIGMDVVCRGGWFRLARYSALDE